jgi:hypothetical protein
VAFFFRRDPNIIPNPTRFDLIRLALKLGEIIPDLMIQIRTEAG